MQFEEKMITLCEADLPAHAGLSSRVYGSEALVATVEHLRWKYLRNPDGPVKALVWEMEGEPIARVVIIPQRFYSGGRAWSGGFVADFVVDPAARGLPLLVSVAKSLNRITEFDFLYMIPNSTGVKFWQGLGKMAPVFDADVTAVPLKPCSLVSLNPKAARVGEVLDSLWSNTLRFIMGLKVRLSSVKHEIVHPGDPRLNALFFQDDDLGIARQRNKDFLDWRFSQDSARRATISMFTKGKQVLGYAVWRDTCFAKRNARMLLDSRCQPRTSSFDRACMLAHMLVHDWPKDVQLMLSISHDHGAYGRLLQSFPLVTVPKRFLPQSVPVFVLCSADARARFDPRKMSFNLADCDIF